MGKTKNYEKNLDEENENLVILHKKIIKKINQMQCIVQNKEQIQIINDFKNLFNICETACKEILLEYNNKKNNNKKKVKKENLILNMKSIPPAIKFAEYTIDKQTLSRIFGSQKNDNKCTAKMLRNAVTHGFERKAIAEIIKYRVELFNLMNDFLNILNPRSTKDD